MKSSWTQDLDTEKSKDVRVNFKESLVVRRRLVEMLEHKIKEFDKASWNPENYNVPNWPYTVADLNGYKRALTLVISLLQD